MGFNAYTEGWALYSEELVDELGFYRDDPFGKIGMYQALRFRAARLVVDTGLHAQRWSREKAIDYLASSTGRARAACTSEVDRYCASPGQACGYKVGHTEILRLREKAKAVLGARFDIRDFNDLVIQTAVSRFRCSLPRLMPSSLGFVPSVIWLTADLGNRCRCFDFPGLT